MNISNLEEPLRLIIKKPYKSFNECIFYDESTKKVNSSDCTSKDLGDYVVCSCTHLTDFSLSKYNPVSIFKDVINLFSQIRIINSFEPFKYLNKDNAFVLYVFCGLFWVYFILLGVMIYLDNSGKSDFFVMIVDKDEKCCSKDEVEEEIETLKTTTEKEILWKNILTQNFHLSQDNNDIEKNKIILKNFGITLTDLEEGNQCNKTKKGDGTEEINIEMKEFTKEELRQKENISKEKKDIKVTKRNKNILKHFLNKNKQNKVVNNKKEDLLNNEAEAPVSAIEEISKKEEFQDKSNQELKEDFKEEIKEDSFDKDSKRTQSDLDKTLTILRQKSLVEKDIVPPSDKKIAFWSLLYVNREFYLN